MTRIEPEIKTLHETRVVGLRSRMSSKHDTTAQLWQQFMPLRNDIEDKLDASLWSVEVYPDPEFFRNFDPSREFEKWATVPVARMVTKPADFLELQIPSGLYAVFTYRGKPSEVRDFFRYIYATWMPASKYSLDHRPHLAVMGAKYKGEHPESEEEIWIPVQKKSAL